MQGLQGIKEHFESRIEREARFIRGRKGRFRKIKKIKRKRMIGHIISTLVEILIGYILIQRVSEWLNLRGFIAIIVKVIGILVIIGALISWV